MKHGLARLLLSFDSKENHEFVCGISHILYDFTPSAEILFLLQPAGAKVP